MFRGKNISVFYSRSSIRLLQLFSIGKQNTSVTLLNDFTLSKASFHKDFAFVCTFLAFLFFISLTLEDLIELYTAGRLVKILRIYQNSPGLKSLNTFLLFLSFNSLKVPLST